MRILFAGGVCNFAYWFAKWGRQLGFDTHALIEEDTSYARDFPQWEDPGYDPARPPAWVHFYRAGPPVDRALHGYSDNRLPALLDRFDSVHTLSPATAIAVDALGRTCVHHTIGSFGATANWWRRLPPRTAVSPRRVPTLLRFRRAMAHAATIVVSTPIEHRDVTGSSYRGKLAAVPMAYDAEAGPAWCSRTGSEEAAPGKLRLLMPARQHWSYKGQDRVFAALAEMGRRERTRLEVVAFDWGVDRERSRELVRSLGLDDVVRFTPMLEKVALWRELSRPGVVVADQFPHLDLGGGGIGGVGRDAMSVATPVITYARPEGHALLHASPPPVLHCEPEPERIRDRIRECLGLGPPELREIGRSGQLWLRRECHYETVVPRYVRLHEGQQPARTGAAA